VPHSRQLALDNHLIGKVFVQCHIADTPLIGTDLLFFGTLGKNVTLGKKKTDGGKIAFNEFDGCFLQKVLSKTTWYTFV
jgi:hypothetical protein